MRRVFLAAAVAGLAATPTLAMDMGCSPASKVTARAPIEAPARAEQAQATPVNDARKTEPLRTAAAEPEDKKVQ